MASPKLRAERFDHLGGVGAAGGLSLGRNLSASAYIPFGGSGGADASGILTTDLTAGIGLDPATIGLALIGGLIVWLIFRDY